MNPSSHAAPDSQALKCELAGEVLRSSGRLRLRASGHSMLPSIWPGDVLVIEQAGSEHVADGDIVVFRRGRSFVAHRVVAKCAVQEDSTIQTRGDAMAQPDAPVQEQDLLGKVSFIIRDGKCIGPERVQSRPERAFSALLQRSEFAARLVVGVHGMRPTRMRPTGKLALFCPTSNDRPVPCQS
jgi:signal peptidase I